MSRARASGLPVNGLSVNPKNGGPSQTAEKCPNNRRSGRLQPGLAEFQPHRTDCHSERSARGVKPRAEGEETAPLRTEDREAAENFPPRLKNTAQSARGLVLQKNEYLLRLHHDQ